MSKIDCIWIWDTEKDRKQAGEMEARVKKQVQEIIECERIYPDYKGLSVEEALTQFKIKIKKKLDKL